MSSFLTVRLDLIKGVLRYGNCSWINVGHETVRGYDGKLRQFRGIVGSIRKVLCKTTDKKQNYLGFNC